MSLEIEYANETKQPLGTQSSVTVIKKATAPKGEAEILESGVAGEEDAFTKYYGGGNANDHTVTLIKPPFDLMRLIDLTSHNNSLGQLVTAMEVNIDGTGYDIEAEEVGDKVTDEQKVLSDGIKDFFKEIYPGKSFITVRRAVRRDVESCGNGYLEVMRNGLDEVAFANHMPGSSIRLVKYGRPMVLTAKMTRFGAEVEYKYTRRVRRYAQIKSGDLVYFKEHGIPRDLNRHTGEWAAEGERLPLKDRATELVHFTAVLNPDSPYGIPRWIAQIPSVLGSRKAEELNLDFFNAGGLPPALIIIEGGVLVGETKKQLESYLSGKGAGKHRAAIVEANSTGGTLDKAGNVSVKVERFGSEKQKDSMFEKYDDKCEMRVRAAFRLPPIFVGKAQDYNFATALASYTVAEAQVFKPERDEFDEMINVTIMRDISDNYLLRSHPLKVQNATNKLQGIALLSNAVDPESAIDTVNEVLGTTLKLREGVTELGAMTAPSTGASDGLVQKSDTIELLEVAKEWAECATGSKQPTPDLVAMVDSFDEVKKSLFEGYVAVALMDGIDEDLHGVVELSGAASEIINKEAACGCGSEHQGSCA